MEAYDAAVLSYAMATAATKIKPGLLGIAPLISTSRIADNESLTPPRQEPDSTEDSIKNNNLHQLLFNTEQLIQNKTVVPLALLMEICATRGNQIDQQVVGHLESLHNELRQIVKSNPTNSSLQFKVDDDIGVSLKTETVCKSLQELFKHFGFDVDAIDIKNTTS